ncbi:MAG: mechanosensitive ion channel [Gammaproteobacteria bacterium]|nr:mechanosensitive ion channel [Gammaproteobacteria bacterium]
MDSAFRPFIEGRSSRLPAAGAAEKRATACLDTTRLPPVRARRVATEAAFMLNDVLDRVPLPPFHEIPDTRAMAKLPPDVPRVWTIPGTEMKIARVMEGPRTGEYLFSPVTVDRAREFYELARNLAYKPGAMDGLYQRIVYAPGPWIPTRWIEVMPDWVKETVVGQSVWKWIGMVFTSVVWLLLVYLAHRFSRPMGGEHHYWRRFLLAVALLPVTTAFRSFYEHQLIVVGPAYVAIDNAIVLLYYLIGAVAILNLGAAIAATIVASPKIEKQSLDANLISAGSRAVAWLCATLVLARGLSVLGVPLLAVVASLGVGGVAFALAARPTLENLIAGVTLYLDKPVRIGQFCQFEDVVGTVERIGLRSTRIRRWGGSLLSIPNAQFAEHLLDNFNDARYIWIRQRLRLRYDTSPDQLSYVLAKTRELLFAHPKIVSPRVRFIGFGDDALTVEIVCYSDTGVWSEWHAIREDVFLRIIDIIERSGTRLALPSTTTYFTRDGGIDEARRDAAEQQVREWIEGGELPFPDMSEAQRAALAGTLSFPPEGSVDYEAKPEKD